MTAFIFLTIFATNVLIIAVYLTGQILHVAANAINTIRSGLNSISTLGGYLRNQGVFILIRIFLTSAAFLIAWENLASVGLGQLQIGVLTRIGFTAFAGYGADSLFEKVAGLIGWAPELPK